MWRARWIDEAVPVGRSFNNDRVFQTIQIDSDEYANPITHYPIPEYMQRRFIPHVERFGPQRIDEQLRSPLPGQAHSFSRETRVLAFLTGLRETGPPLMAGIRPRREAVYEEYDGNIYLRNHTGSGLDFVNESRSRHGVLDHLDSSARNRGSQHLFDRRVVRDDPHSDHPADVLINQEWLRTIFSAYFRHQQDTFLGGMNLDGMDRPVRLFWRTLTFGGPGGASWRESRRAGSPGRETVKNLIDLLGLGYNDVRSLWDDASIRRQVAQIDDSERQRLASLARQSNNFGRIEAIRARIPYQVSQGLSNARYYQAIKMAAITEGFLVCMNQGVFRAVQP